jgi:hypothetical protein
MNVGLKVRPPAAIVYEYYLFKMDRREAAQLERHADQGQEQYPRRVLQELPARQSFDSGLNKE